jgi:thioredoxin
MDVTTETFEHDVIERSHELPVVVDFWAAWCGPCRMLGPALETEAGKRAGRLELVKLDVEAEQELAARYGIQSIPTVAVFRDGKPVTGFIGAHPARVIGDFFDEHVLAQSPEQPVSGREDVR